MRALIKLAIIKFYYVKTCIQRAQSYYSFLASLVQQFALVSILLKLYGKSPEVLMVCLFFVFVLLAFIVGHIDVKYGLFRAENKLQNKYNAEFMEIYDIIKNQGKKDDSDKR